MKTISSSVREITNDCWHACRAYHAATTSKQRWSALLDLMKVALSGKTRVAEQARKMLANEGLLVHRATQANSA